MRPEGFIMRCDHHSLSYIFDPLGRGPSIACHAAMRLFLWALRLASFSYAIELLPDGIIYGRPCSLSFSSFGLLLFIFRPPCVFYMHLFIKYTQYRRIELASIQ